MALHNHIGKRGEALAKTYLQKQGYAIVEQNYKTKYAEIDFVARKKNILVFVEVRTRTGEQFCLPEDTISRQKQWKLTQNARAYTGRKKYKGMYRIDALCIVLTEQQKLDRIRHYENICA